MVKTKVFTHSLSLALRVVDTATGYNIPGRDLTVSIDGKKVWLQEKDDGVLTFQDLEPRAFHLEVSAPYYEKEEREVDLDQMDQRLPLLELELIPGKNFPEWAELQELEGVLPGIQELTAVPAGENSCLIQEFDPRRRVMKMFNPHRLALERISYALVDPEENRYEIFRILKRIDDFTLKIDRVLEMPIRNSFPISPVVTGRCGPQGRYRLCTRREMGGARWLLRWVVEDQVFFRLVDFRETPHPRLE